MPERLVVARTRWIDDDVGVESGRNRVAQIGDGRACGNRLQVRSRDRAGLVRRTMVVDAVLGDVEGTASRRGRSGFGGDAGRSDSGVAISGTGSFGPVARTRSEKRQ